MAVMKLHRLALLPVVPDLVQRRFSPEVPNQLWSGDITYKHYWSVCFLKRSDTDLREKCS